MKGTYWPRKVFVYKYVSSFLDTFLCTVRQFMALVPRNPTAVNQKGVFCSVEWTCIYCLVSDWNFTYPLVTECSRTYHLMSEWGVTEWNFPYASPVSHWKVTYPSASCTAWCRIETSRTPWSENSRITWSQSEVSHRFTSFLWCVNFCLRLLFIMRYKQDRTSFCFVLNRIYFIHRNCCAKSSQALTICVWQCPLLRFHAFPGGVSLLAISLGNHVHMQCLLLWMVAHILHRSWQSV
jgi:hypothetical protein